MPDAEKQYALIVDASTGALDFEGGFGAILTQIDTNNPFAVIAYASRLLSNKEKQVSPFLLEMRAMVWATSYFQSHLRGQQFILFTNHKPVRIFPPIKLPQSSSNWPWKLTSSSSTRRASICPRITFQGQIYHPCRQRHSSDGPGSR